MHHFCHKSQNFSGSPDPDPAASRWEGDTPRRSNHPRRLRRLDSARPRRPWALISMNFHSLVRHSSVRNLSTHNSFVFQPAVSAWAKFGVASGWPHLYLGGGKNPGCHNLSSEWCRPYCNLLQLCDATLLIGYSYLCNLATLQPIL